MGTRRAYEHLDLNYYREDDDDPKQGPLF